MRRIAILVLTLALIVPMTAGAATADQDPDGITSAGQEATAAQDPNGASSAGQGATAAQDPDGVVAVGFGPLVDSLFRVIVTHLGI